MQQNSFIYLFFISRGGGCFYGLWGRGEGILGHYTS